MKIEDNLKISKFAFFSSLFLFLLFLYLFLFFPENLLFSKLVDVFLTSASISLALVICFITQRDFFVSKLLRPVGAIMKDSYYFL